MTLLALCLILVAARPGKKSKRHFRQKEGRTDLVVKSKNHGFEITQVRIQKPTYSVLEV